MLKKYFAALLASVLLLAVPALGTDEGYTDVPTDSWAVPVLAKAKNWGLIDGLGQGAFGFGEPMTRAQFVTVLCRMMDWEMVQPTALPVIDVAVEKWYAPYIQAAFSHGVLDAGAFRPEDSILRQEMAVMLVRALGYDSLAGQVAGYGHPFTDIDPALDGYITIAYDIGMTKGQTPTTFAPAATAKREEAAAMLVRIYEKLRQDSGWVHGFYAFSSYSQRYVIADMDAVSFGWSNLRLDEEGVWLNTTSKLENQRRIPTAYESITEEISALGKKAHLDVFMNTAQTYTTPAGESISGLRTLLGSAEYRSQAVDAIITEATRVYPELERSPYSGVTIDFEGLRREEREGFVQFLSLLSQQLVERGMTLYVAVHPATADGIFYDGYDYPAIGALADKVILMAHDYQALNLSGMEGTGWHKTTALTPIAQVYYALRAVTDPQTGVQDHSKLALAISFASIGWEISSDDKLVNPKPFSPDSATVAKRLAQPGTVPGWSDTYRNPYATYQTESGQTIFLWYEDARSVAEKQQLARLFGINGVSYWRIGQIPDAANYSIRPDWIAQP